MLKYIQVNGSILVLSFNLSGLHEHETCGTACKQQGVKSLTEEEASVAKKSGMNESDRDAAQSLQRSKDEENYVQGLWGQVLSGPEGHFLWIC